MRFGFKSLTAVVAATALLVLSSSPASATVVSFEVTDGALITNAGTFVLAPGGTPTPPCGSPDGHVDIDETGSGPWSTTVTDVDITTSIMKSSLAHLVEITEHTGSRAGTIAIGSPHVVEQDLSLRIEVFATTGTPPNCAKGLKVCTVQVNFNDFVIGGSTLAGTTPDTPIHTTGDTIDLDGAGRVSSILGQSCTPTFATMLNSTATLSDLDLTGD